MSHRRRIGLSITNSSLSSDRQHEAHQFLKSLKWLYPLKNEEDDAEVRKIETIRHRRSQLEVKSFFFTENLKNEGTGTIRLEQRFDHFFSLFINRRFFRFSSVKEEKDKFWRMKKNNFLWRHSLLDPTSVTEVHITFSHPPPAPVHRTTFLG